MMSELMNVKNIYDGKEEKDRLIRYYLCCLAASVSVSLDLEEEFINEIF